MAKVQFNGIVTEHETAIEVAKRLAACCTFHYADIRDERRMERKPHNGTVDVWLVFNFGTQTWRVTEPRLAFEGEYCVTPYTIDGRKSEGETARELLKMIETGDMFPLSIDRCVEAAEVAFWSSVAGAYPDVETGDMPPGMEMLLKQTMRTAVEAWLRANKKER